MAATTFLGLLLGAMAVQPVADERLRVVDYDPTAITRLAGCLGFETAISLAPDEHAENIALGDATSWQVVPNQRGDLVYARPVKRPAFSNLAIITNKRTYNFELRDAPEADCKLGRMAYVLRFRYPPEAQAGGS